MRVLVAVVLLLNVSCSVNILENFAEKTSNDALYFDAKKLIDGGDYTAALAKIDLMTDDFEAGRGITTLKAQAHAGLCGLNFFDFVLALRNLGSQKMLQFLVTNFRSGAVTTKFDHCVTAESLIKGLGAVGARSLDENLLLLLVSFTKVGQILSFYADADQNGTATPAYDVCTIATAGTRTAGATMPDEDAREVGTGLTVAMESLTAVAGQIDLGSGSLDSLASACSSAPAGYNFCTKTTAADFTANELLAIRSFIREGSAFGLDLNGCAGGSVSGSASCRCF